MAWFRAGGGGIPAALKSEMNDVLNKKFGTILQNYPPEEWPETVNLMGPLPERTVSGAVVAFADGADTVPLKKCAITIPANLTGVSSVAVVHCGKNLMPSDITWTQGIRNNTGEWQSSTASHYTAPIKVNPSTDYTIQGAAYPTLGFRIYYLQKDETWLERTASYTTDPYTFTTPANCEFIQVQCRLGTTATDIQIEKGTTATEFEAYNGTTHTANLGRTIYGGSVDVVNGTGTETYGKTSLDDKPFNYISNITCFNVAISGAISSGYKDDIVIPTGYTISHTLIQNAANAPDMTMCMYNGSLYIKNLSCTSQAELQTALNGEYLIYPISTPEDFTFTPVPILSRLGDNTMWSDDGDLSVTYRRDIDLALAQ